MANKPLTPNGASRSSAKKRIRKIFGDIHEVVQMPNLIEVQRESYEQFLRSNPAIGYVSGLEKTLRSVFPIRDFAGTSELDFVHYELEEPKYDVTECRQRGITFAAPMKVTLRLIVFEVDAETETRSVLDIKEQDVYMGDMPLMTENGTFFINGTERVIVSQMHRSPGVLFDHDRGKTHSSGKFLFAARVIPYRGSWLDFEFDAKDIVNVRIDRKRKLPVTSLLYGLGLDAEQILNHFYETVTWNRGEGGWRVPYAAEQWRGQKPTFDIVDAKSGEVIFAAGTKISPRAATKAAKDGLAELLIPTEEIFGRYAARDVIDESTGRIWVESGDEVSPENLDALDKAGIDRLDLLDIDHVNTGPWIRNTLKADKAENRDMGLEAIYKITPKGESPMTPEEKLLRAIFGEKASDVRDTSLRLPPGVAGTIVDVRVFNRHGIEIDDRTRAIQNEEIERLAKDREDERGILNRATYNRLREMLIGQVAAAAPKGIKKGTDIDAALLEEVERHEWWKFAVADDKMQGQLEAVKAQYDETIKTIQEKFEDRKEKLERGDELAPGVLKMVKVFVAVKRKLQPGDKMAGRHGNKGVISRILPCEDMPFLEDGTHVDIVLNPLGVPSRMNVGQ
ncbi:hypothetical protein B566_EDAN019367, partial [Ephemera danica]